MDALTVDQFKAALPEKVRKNINQALIDLLAAKGIITQEELMAKIEQIRREIRTVTY